MEFFAKRNAIVTIVERMPIIGNGLDPITKVDTNSTMKKYNVNQLTNTSLLEVKSDSFSVKLENGENKDLFFDYGFVCLGMKSNNPILDELKDCFDDEVEILNIGDSFRARRIIEGVFEGRNILSTLSKLNYLDSLSI